jgi:hypothetical protein
MYVGIRMRELGRASERASERGSRRKTLKFGRMGVRTKRKLSLNKRF